jgi:NAD(P)-dependent dehydrogenase (short-subunit alcohol dehydrogenase family)
MTDTIGRIAFITGGANGIGLGIARALAGAGTRLALVDLDRSALERARDELSKVTEVETAVLDIRDRDGFSRVADEIEARIGPVSLLFNNAGVGGGAPAEKLSYELWDWGLGINLGGVINGIQTFLPRMIERGLGGHIVNTGSGAGLAIAGSGAGALYYTAKYAVVGMAEALAVDLAPYQVGVSVLCPGPVATGIVSRSEQMSPKLALDLDADQERTAQERRARGLRWLERGAHPDEVGVRVLDAIRKNQLHIHTDRYIEPYVAARHAALLAALPSG